MLKKMTKNLFKVCFGIFLISMKAEGVAWNHHDDCGCDEHVFVEAEYLYWTVKDAKKFSPLVISAPSSSSNPSPNLLGPDTSIALGCKNLGKGWTSGGKLSLGYHFDYECISGTAEVNYFFLPNTSKSQTIRSDGTIGSPAFAVTLNEDQIFVIAYPLLYTGTATVKQSNRMQGAELNGWFKIPNLSDFKATWLLGFRYWNFDERWDFNVSSPYVPPSTEVFLASDKFNAKNHFYGAQLGLGIDTLFECFSCNAKIKVAMGAMCGSSKIKGEFLTNNFNEPPAIGDPKQYEGGFFAFPSNIGLHKTTKFGMIPELNVHVGYEFSRNFRLHIGYTFLYANNVLRASKQLDRNINQTQSVLLEEEIPAILSGPSVPTGSIKTSNFWAQGMNVGIVFLF